MKIEVWSDFVCPFCYIGKRRLEIALNKFENKNEVEVEFKSFELDPVAKKKYDESIHEIIAKKYGITAEQAKESNDQIILQAKAVGLNYNFDNIIPTNTFDAHRMSHFAKTEGKMNELSERILKAYFEDSLNISDHKVLTKLASEVGLDREKALRVLESDQYVEDVRMDEHSASKHGVRGVPYFIFNDKHIISGAQPVEVFLDMLKRVKKEEISLQDAETLSKEQVQREQENQADYTGKCSDGECKI